MIGNFLLHLLAISQTSIHVESFSETQPCNYRTKSVLLLSSLSDNTMKRKKQTTTMTMTKPQPYTAETLSLTEMSTVSRMQRKLEALYLQSSKIRCPFFRRRAADSIDNIAMILRFLAVRHKSLGFSELLDVELPGCKPVGSLCKTRNLHLQIICDRISDDWGGLRDNGANEFAHQRYGKGYYITGNLDSTVYRDDCLFDGPDPDMPVRGLRKYLAAASQLFHPKDSYAQLLSLCIVGDTDGKFGKGLIEATWKLGGVLNLPWKPVVKPWTGRTIYHVDEEGLIAFHEEYWDISVVEAFVCTLWPKTGLNIWGNDNSGDSILLHR